MKPRLPTAEERKLWRENNKQTVKAAREAEESDAGESGEKLGEGGDAGLPPLPSRERQRRLNERSEFSRSGEGVSTLGAPSPRPLTQPSPARGEGSPASPLEPLSTREGNRVFKSHPVSATLDLHGLTQWEAQDQLQQFIERAVRSGKRHVVVITGKGRGQEIGVLRRRLPEWLNSPALRPLISGFGEAKPEKGGAGVTHVLLKAR